MDYYAKLLLFGEYTIIQGSQALAMPLPLYRGRWAFGEPSGHSLEDFVRYLKKKAAAGELEAGLGLDAMEEEINRGLHFDSNIPIGYGVGSSGALCAATYDRYAIAPIKRKESHRFAALRQQLAQIEGYFHGSSSGTDPLISSLGQPVLLLPGQRARIVGLPAKTEDTGHFFLLDTGLSRNTGPLVERFLRKAEDAAFSRAVEEKLKPANEQAITYYLSGTRTRLMPVMKQISELQYEHFREMIPSAFRQAWKDGLEGAPYVLKLCGAGGGGFLLGYSEGSLEKEWEPGKYLPLPKI